MTDSQDNDDIKKLPLKERLEYQKIQAEIQEHQAQARELKKWLVEKPAFWGAISPVILAGCVLFITWIFGFLSSQKEIEKLLTQRIDTLRKEVISNEKTILDEIAILRDSVNVEGIGSGEEITEKQAKELKLLDEKLAKVKTEDEYSSVDWFYKGISEYGKMEYDKAIEDYNKAIELSPESMPSFHNRGIVYSKLNQHDKAIEDYNKAIGLDPEFASSYYNRGIAFANLKQYDKVACSP